MDGGARGLRCGPPLGDSGFLGPCCPPLKGDLLGENPLHLCYLASSLIGRTLLVAAAELEDEAEKREEEEEAGQVGKKKLEAGWSQAKPACSKQSRLAPSKAGLLQANQAPLRVLLDPGSLKKGSISLIPRPLSLKEPCYQGPAQTDRQTDRQTAQTDKQTDKNTRKAR